MERREFMLQGLAVLLANGLAACAPHHLDPAMAADDVAAWLTRIDRQAATIRATPLDGPTRAAFAAAGLAENTITDLFGSLLWVAVFRSAPTHVRRDAAFQSRMLDEGERLYDHAQGMRDWLASLPRTRRREFARIAREQRHLLDNHVDEVRRRGAEIAQPQGMADDLLRTLDGIWWRMDHQEPSILVDEAIDATDRAAQDPIGVADLNDLRPEADHDADLPTISGRRRLTRHQKSKIGLTWFGIGVLFTVTVLLAVCVGIPLMLIGIGWLIASAATPACEDGRLPAADGQCAGV